MALAKMKKEPKVSLVSLKRTNREKKDIISTEVDALGIEDYSWGLTITLEHGDLQKLGFAQLGLEAGSSVNVVARAMVKANTVDMTGEGMKRTMTLQFQDMEMSPVDPKDAPNEARVIYNGKVAKS